MSCGDAKGTSTGAARHARARTPNCPECRHAELRDKAIRLARKGEQQNCRIPYTLLGALLRHAPEELYNAAQELLSPGAVEAAEIVLALEEEQLANEERKAS